MHGYFINIDSYRNYEDRIGGDHPTDDWNESYTNTIDNVAEKVFETPSGRVSIASELDLPSGADAFVVWAEWTYGDSFGYASRGSAEVFGIFEHEYCANELANYLRSRDFNCGMFHRHEENEARCDFQTSDGQRFDNLYFPWLGYFEELDDVHIQPVRIK